MTTAAPVPPLLEPQATRASLEGSPPAGSHQQEQARFFVLLTEGQWLTGKVKRLLRISTHGTKTRPICSSGDSLADTEMAGKKKEVTEQRAKARSSGLPALGGVHQRGNLQASYSLPKTALVPGDSREVSMTPLL